METKPKFSSEEYERLKFWKDMVVQEQTWFWQRFAGFAALQAALLVVASSAIQPFQGWSQF
jgi:hypothetical protein